MNNERIEKLIALASDETSYFEKKALWRKANKNWLKKSTAIAIKVHSAIKQQKISQVKLADKMGVSAQYISKILKGSENLSLDTISKLETQLGIQLIEVCEYSYSNNYTIPEIFQSEVAWTQKNMVDLFTVDCYDSETEVLDEKAA